MVFVSRFLYSGNMSFYCIKGTKYHSNPAQSGLEMTKVDWIFFRFTVIICTKNPHGVSFNFRKSFNSKQSSNKLLGTS